MAVVDNNQQSEASYYLTITYSPPGQEKTVRAAAIPLTNDYHTALISSKNALRRYLSPGSSDKHWWLAIPAKSQEEILWVEVSPEVFAEIIQRNETEFRLCEDHRNVRLLSLEDDRVTTYKFKMIIIGEMSVGKSMMLQYFTKPEKDRKSELPPTIGVRSDISTRFITTQSSRIQVEFWDTAGQEKFRSISRSHYRGTNCALLVYKVTNSDSFLACKAWLRALRTEVDEDVPIMLVGNQIDLSNLRKVKTSEGQKFADDNDLLFAEVSAKKGTGVDHAFQTLVDEVYRRLSERNKLSEYDTSKTQNVKLSAQEGKGSSYLSIWMSSAYDAGVYVIERTRASVWYVRSYLGL